MMYDTSSRTAFINIRNWFSHVMNKGDPHLQVVLVGYTASSSAGVVTDQEGQALAAELDIPYCAVREGAGVEDVQAAFLRLYQAMGTELEHSRGGLQDYCAVM